MTSTEVCICEAGWGGPDCTTEVNPCLTRGCRIGTCTLTDTWFECTCPQGYKPDFQCEVAIDVCFENTCGDHGSNCTIPVPHNGVDYSCTCDPGLFTN